VEKAFRNLGAGIFEKEKKISKGKIDVDEPIHRVWRYYNVRTEEILSKEKRGRLI